MRDYRAIDWNAERPEWQAIQDACEQLHIEALPTADPRIDALVQSLGQTHCNGGALVGRFEVSMPDALAWLVSRNRFGEAPFFRAFFRNPVVQAAWPRLGEIDHADIDLGFAAQPPFSAFGQLADVVFLGGAYVRFPGAPKEALDLVRGFTQAAFEDRFDEVLSFVSWQPWSRFFHDVAWDGSFFWFDKANGVVTVLLRTDTD